MAAGAARSSLEASGDAAAARAVRRGDPSTRRRRATNSVRDAGPRRRWQRTRRAHSSERTCRSRRARGQAMTEPPKLELVPDTDADAEVPPATPLQHALREALDEQLAPVLETWDARTRDMLDVLAEASDAKQQVRSAARTIKLAGWIGVAGLLLSGFAIWRVLEQERLDRRVFREQEQVRRLEAAQLIIDAGREDVRRIDVLVRDMGERCPKR